MVHLYKSVVTTDQLGDVIKESLQMLPKLYKKSFLLTLCSHRQTEADRGRGKGRGEELTIAMNAQGTEEQHLWSYRVYSLT